MCTVLYLLISKNKQALGKKNLSSCLNQTFDIGVSCKQTKHKNRLMKNEKKCTQTKDTTLHWSYLDQGWGLLLSGKFFDLKVFRNKFIDLRKVECFIQFNTSPFLKRVSIDELRNEIRETTRHTGRHIDRHTDRTMDTQIHGRWTDRETNGH